MRLRGFFFIIILANVNGNAINIILSQNILIYSSFLRFLNSFRSLSVVFNLEARCVVKKIQELFLLLGSGIILVSPFRLNYLCS